MQKFLLFCTWYKNGYELIHKLERSGEVMAIVVIAVVFILAARLHFCIGDLGIRL